MTLAPLFFSSSFLWQPHKTVAFWYEGSKNDCCDKLSTRRDVGVVRKTRGCVLSRGWPRPFKKTTRNGRTSPRSRGPHSKRFASKKTRVSEARTRAKKSVCRVGGVKEVKSTMVLARRQPPNTFRRKTKCTQFCCRDATLVVFSTCACERVCACALYYYQGCNLLYII